MKAITLRKAFDELWAMDVVIVVAAGNDGNIVTLDQIVPQEFDTNDNELITVGGVSKTGLYYEKTTNKKGQLPGQVNHYAGAMDVTLAKYDGDDSATKVETGTSFAAPAVVCLLISSPSGYGTTLIHY